MDYDRKYFLKYMDMIFVEVATISNFTIYETNVSQEL